MSLSRRWLSWSAIAALALLPQTVHATIAPPVTVRWIGPAPAPARAGEELAGRFEIRAGAAGRVEDLALEGEGWTIRPLRVQRSMMLARGERREIDFSAVPRAPGEPIVVRFRFEGREFRKEFRFDEPSVQKKRAGRLALVDGARVAPKDPGPGTDASLIRFRGRFTYFRSDFVERGADSIVVRIMDDDSPDPFDEVIWEGFTDGEGRFDVTVAWDDGADDPDIYLVAIAANSRMDVHDDDLFQTTWSWSTEDNVIEDYTGNDVIFGVVQPGNLAEHGAVHVYNSTIRAWRHAWQRGGMAATPVEVFWPSSEGTFYRSSEHDIHIKSDETWVEGTIVHEFGHHLQQIFGNPAYDGGDDNFCGSGHCVWCPESEVNAFAEGWANWFGYTVMAQWFARYAETPLSINDGRYVLETPDVCCADPTPGQPCSPNMQMPSLKTEGYLAALLRDIEDASNDDHNPGDCDTDVMTIGDDEIYTVFREDAPTTARQFVDAFRLRYYEHDQDLHVTARNVDPLFAFPTPVPVIYTQPAPCITVRPGETATMQVIPRGRITGGTPLKFQWRWNGAPLFDGPGMIGTETNTLVLQPVTANMTGTYTCLVTTCNDSLSTLSLACEVTVLPAVQPRALISWGVNTYGQVGDGTTEWRRPPTLHEGMPDMVKATGGAGFTIGLRSSGQVYSWGSSGSGELGDGDYSSHTVTNPVAIAGLTDVLEVAAGDNYGLALKRDGSIWGWGWNGHGQLGDGTQNARYVPTRGSAVDGCVRAIAAGSAHTLALMSDGTVQSMGSNSHGQLGLGTSGGFSTEPQTIPGLTNVEAIAAIGYNSYALKTDGTVWAWGHNQSGSLGTGVDGTVLPHSGTPAQVQGLPVIRKITAGYNCAFAISNEGAAYAWGDNTYGVLGIGSTSTQELTPVLISGLTLPVRIVAGWGVWAGALQSDGTVWVWGYNDGQVLGREWTSLYMRSPLQVEGVQAVTALGAAWSTVHATGDLTGVTGVDDATVPAVLALRATPNPSFARTRISFDLPLPGRVSLSIYDVTGRRVRSLLDEFREPGRYDAAWDGRGDSGGPGMAGVFFARLELNGMVLTERVVRIR